MDGMISIAGQRRPKSEIQVGRVSTEIALRRPDMVLRDAVVDADGWRSTPVQEDGNIEGAISRLVIAVFLYG